MNWLFLIYIFILFILFTPNIWITVNIDKNILYLLHGFVFTFLLYFCRYMFDIKESMINNKTFDITVNNHPNMNVHRDKYIQYYREYYKQIQEKQNKKYAENIKKAEEEIEKLDNMIQQQIHDSEVKKGEINKQLDRYKAYQEGKLNELKAAQAKNLELQKKNEQDIKNKFNVKYKSLMEAKALVEINYKNESSNLKSTIADLNSQIQTNTDSYQQQLLQQQIEVTAQQLLLRDQQNTAESIRIEKDAEITRQKAIVEINKIKYDGDILTINNENKRIIEEKNSNIATLNATNLQLDTALALKITELSAEREKNENAKTSVEALRSEYNATITAKISEMEGLDSNVPGDLEKINILAADLDGYVTGLRKNRIDNQENYNKLFAGTEELNKQYTTLTDEKEKIEKDFSNLKSSYDTNINNNKELQSSFDALKKKKDDLEQALGDLQTSYDTNIKNNKDLQSSFDILKQEKGDLDDSYTKLQQEKGDLEKALGDLENQTNTISGNVSGLKAQYNTLQQEKGELSTKYNELINTKNKLKTDYDDIELKLKTKSNEYTALQDTKDKLKTDYDDIKLKLNSKSNEYNDLVKKINSNDYRTAQEYNELNTQLETKNTEIETKKNEIETKKNEIETMKNEIETKNTEIANQKKEIANKNNELTELSAKLADIKLAISNWDTSNATYIQSINDKMVTPKNNYINDINTYNNDVNNTLRTTMNELTLCSRNPKGNVPIARGRQSSDVRYTDAYAEAVWYDSGDGGYTNVLYYRWMNTGHDAVYVYMFADDYVKLYVNDNTFRGSSNTNHTYSSPGAYTPHKIDTSMGLKKFGCNTFKFKIYDDRKSEHFTAAVYSKYHDKTTNGSMKKYALFATGPSWNEGWFFISSMKRREGTSYTLPASEEHEDTRATSTPDKTILDSIIESTKKMPSLNASNYVVDNNDIITKKKYSMSAQQSVMSILNNVDSGNNSNVYKTQYDKLYSKYNNELDSHKDEISKLKSDYEESLDKSNHYIRNLEIRNKCKPPTGSDNPSKHGKKITNRIYNDVGAEGIWDNVWGSNAANVLYYNWLNPGLDKVYVYMYCDDYVKLYVNGFNWVASSTYHGAEPSIANEVVPRSDGKGFLKNGCNVFKFLVRERDGDQHLTVAVYAQPHDSKKSAQENEKNLLFASGPKWNQDWYVFEEMRTTGETNNELRLSDGKARQPSWLQDWIDGLNASSFIYKPVTKENCLESAKAEYGDKVTKGLNYGNWDHVPQGCSVNRTTSVAHWNDTDGKNNGNYTEVVVPLSIK
jgi:predicted  nucleic acid-binding Zn-ribbon protein